MAAAKAILVGFMVQNSPKNLEYRMRGDSFEVAFFYLNVGKEQNPTIDRVDIPLWVARERRSVDALHGILLHQSRLQGRNPYPYALTRADELALVGKRDLDKVDEMVRVEVRRVKEEMTLETVTPKARGKELARDIKKREFEV